MKIGTVLIIGAVLSGPCFADSVTLTDIQNKDYGVLGTLNEESGSLMGARVLYMRLKREIVPLNERHIRVDLRYPKIPDQVLRTVKLPQAGAPLNCKVSAEGLAKGLIQVEAKTFDSNVRDLGPGLDPSDQDLFNFGKPAGEDRVCSVTLALPPSMSPATASSFIESGLPNLKVRARTYISKDFSAITAPYVQFLNEDSVTFNTDDEFWFLVAASVHQEPDLLKRLLRSDWGYIENWIKNFAFNVVEQVDSLEYQKQLYQNFGENHKIQKSYTIPADANEVEYVF